VVTWIYDGDTIAVDIERGSIDVRLLDVNAPERDECFYGESLDYQIETLKGRDVSLDIDADPDQFGRTLAYVWDGDRNVNLDLVQAGLAIATTPDSGGGFLADEEEAFQSGTGLWSDDACGSGPIPNVIIVALDSSGETIVIINEETTMTDLSGWTLRDESSRHRYRFPTGVTIQPGARLTISSDDGNWDPGGSSVWNNDGDMALLLDRDGRVVYRWRY
jgi:Lamin Tail Domain/Staphylococcal nuclease homologue